MKKMANVRKTKDAFESIHQELKERKDKAEEKHAELITKILSYEHDLKAQDERRQEGAVFLKKEKAIADGRDEEMRILLQSIKEARTATHHIRNKVATNSVYKEYVEKSVAWWGNEANTVEGVCGRFRDLLTLRFELLSQVKSAVARVQEAREKKLKLIQNEKEKEGQALLELYRARSDNWERRRKVEESETRLAAFQAASAQVNTHLTKLSLAINNIYSVARLYQSSLPPISPKVLTSVVLKRLHNFMLDATTVTKIARQELCPLSDWPTIGSVPEDKDPSKQTPKDSDDNTHN